MQLAQETSRDERGFAMAALLVALVIMAVAMSVDAAGVAHAVGPREGGGADLARAAVPIAPFSSIVRKPRRPALRAWTCSSRAASCGRNISTRLPAVISRWLASIPSPGQRPGDAAAEDRIRPIDRRRSQQEQGTVLPGTRWQEDLRRMAVRVCAMEARRSAGAPGHSRSWWPTVARPAATRIRISTRLRHVQSVFVRKRIHHVRIHHAPGTAVAARVLPRDRFVHQGAQAREPVDGIGRSLRVPHG